MKITRVLSIALICFAAAGCRDRDSDSGGPGPVIGDENTPAFIFGPAPEPATPVVVEPIPNPDPDVPSGLGWVVQTSGVQQDITSVTSNDGLNAWAAGGGILRTINGGAEWTSAMGGPFKQVEFIDSQNGWAITDQEILSSTNGGQTWTTRKTSIDNPFVALSFINANTGVVLASHDELYRTIDGGVTWTTITVAPTLSQAQRALRAVEFVNGAVGWILAADLESGGEAIFKSVNGGVTWQKQFVIHGALLTDIAAANPNDAWIVGILDDNSGIILATSNGGEDWNQQEAGAFGGLRAVTFVNTLVGWAVGDLILHTEDGGETWSVQASPEGVTFFDVDFVNATVGWAVGSNGTILKTTTGGD